MTVGVTRCKKNGYERIVQNFGNKELDNDRYYDVTRLTPESYSAPTCHQPMIRCFRNNSAMVS